MKKQKSTQGQQDIFYNPWWHSPFVGYPLALVFTAVAFLTPLAMSIMGISDYFVSTPFIVATIVVGWIWGIGPALFALLLEMLGIDYWLIPPLHVFTLFRWPDFISYGLLGFIQIIILHLVITQKKVRQQLLLAEREAARRAEAVAESNRALIESNTRLAQAHQVKDQFFSRASHELKTPITTIRGQVQLALRRLSRQKELPDDFIFLLAYLAKVEDQTYHLQNLVDDLLNLSSLHAGKIPLRVVPCDPGSLCRGIVEDQCMLTDRQIDLKLSEHALVLQADQERFSQVIINLVTNAIKYSPVDTAILVEVYQELSQVILAVHNDGSLLSKEEQESIFEPFYRTPGARSSSAQGCGLGLAISREIVAQHHGQIWVESSEAKGTTFFVTLPLCQ